MVTIEKVIFGGGGGRKKGEDSKPKEIQAREHNEGGTNGVNEAKITVDDVDKNKG